MHALPSLFTRAFHSRPTQPTASDLLEQTSTLNRLLPQQHPLLIHRTDYQIHHATPQGPNGGTGVLQGSTSSLSTSSAVATTSTFTGRGIEADPQQPESILQQLVTNISAVTGSNELLGFGGFSGGQRTRTTAGQTSTGAGTGTSSSSSNSSGSGGSSAQTTIDDGLESTTIPSTFSRWEEESAAIDGHMPHLVMRVLREDILSTWIDAYEKENGPKDDQNNRSGSTSTGAGTENDVSSGQVQSSQGESSGSGSGEGASVGTQQQQQQQPPQGDTTPGTITVPNPSDEATPSSHSPRDQNSVVDQLRSGLRQVADALAQTVAAVRSTREQLLQSRESESSSTTVVATTSNGGSSSAERECSGGATVSCEAMGEQKEEGHGGGEEMESQSASVGEATGEELSTPMEESVAGSQASSLFATISSQDEQMQQSHPPVTSSGECECRMHVCEYVAVYAS